MLAESFGMEDMDAYCYSSDRRAFQPELYHNWPKRGEAAAIASERQVMIDIRLREISQFCGSPK
jgi:hypothetical protein